MNSEKLNSWLTLLANIGVVIGLALLQSHYIQYARGYLDHDTAHTILRDAVSSLPYWEELGYELGNSDFEQAIKKAAGR